MKRSTATGKNRKFVVIIFVCACAHVGFLIIFTLLTSVR